MSSNRSIFKNQVFETHEQFLELFYSDNETFYDTWTTADRCKSGGTTFYHYKCIRHQNLTKQISLSEINTVFTVMA